MDIRNELIQKAKEIGVKVSPQQAEQFQNYLDLLLERNEVVNLTAITDPHEAVVKHFVDSLTLLKAVEIKKGAKLVDVGTGAGFPGLPVKIMRPDIELTLLDSLNKRLIFLKDVCAAIGVEANCIHKRAEEAGRQYELARGILYSAHQDVGYFCGDERPGARGGNGARQACGVRARLQGRKDSAVYAAGCGAQRAKHRRHAENGVYTEDLSAPRRNNHQKAAVPRKVGCTVKQPCETANFRCLGYSKAKIPIAADIFLLCKYLQLSGTNKNFTGGRALCR